MARPTQSDRPIGLIGPLGEDDLLLQSFSGQEGISIPFHFDLLLMSPDAQIKARDVVGKTATIRVELGASRQRFINGIIGSFTQTDATAHQLARYHATLVPALWGTTRKANCRVFQNASVLDILRQVWKFPGLDLNTSGLNLSRYTPREICIQYSETDFHFGSRLLEEEGIFYFFEHIRDTEGFKHRVVLADEPQAFHPVPDLQAPSGAGFADYRAQGSAGTSQASIRSWAAAEEMRPDSYRLRDYDFENPRLDLEVSANSSEARRREIYDYPGDYVTRERGQRLVGLRIEEIEAAQTVISGSGNYRHFMAGFRFNLSGHFRQDFNGRAFTITSVFHSFKQQNVFLGTNGPPPAEEYCNTFQCIPHPTPFRPPRTTRTPVIASAQTATVVGPNTADQDGNVPPVPPHTVRDDIYTDPHGRVKVRFHWDRTHLINGDTTCFVRVAQPWAGPGFGHQWIPRVGSEVVVTFLEGNPDRPLIVGSVYNGSNRLPFTIPDCKTQSGIRTHTNPYDPDSRDDKFHMLRFDDQADREQVFLRSQKRLDVRALASYFDTCGGDRNTLIGWKDERTQGGDYNLTVGNDTNVHIQGGRYDRMEKVLNVTVVGNVIQDLEANSATLVHDKSELNAKQVIVEASEKICLKCGSSFILIEPSGVTIYGSSVKINSGGWGVETGDPTIEDPLDAEGADTGKPCNRLRTAHGGGRRARGRRQLRSQHAPSSPRAGEDPRMTAIRNRLQNSAAGRHALEVYDRYGVTSSFTPGIGGFHNPQTNNMNLDPTWGDYNNPAFVHEMDHAQAQHEGTRTDINNPDRAAYVEGMLREEAHGDAVANQAERELTDAGFPQTHHAPSAASYNRGYTNATDAYRRAHPNATPEELEAAGRAGGEQATLDDYRAGRFSTSNTGEPYNTYYGNAWDRAHPRPAGSGGSGGSGSGAPDAGAPDAGAPDAGPADASPSAGVP